MKRWRFVLESVTPVYLGGKNPKEAEWRPTTLKNLMRWWYRAGKAEVSPTEGDIFGTTDNSSQFRLNVRPVKGEPQEMDFEPRSGFQYLGYSLDKRTCFPPRSRVEITISHRWMKQDEQRIVLASLWLMIWLGGIGARWRRGFGSVSIIENEGELSSFEWSYQNVNGSFHDFLSRNLQIARDWLSSVDSGSALPDYSLISPEHTRLYLSKASFEYAQDAMEEAGKMLREFRKRKYDYRSVREYLSAGTPPPTIHRAAFGLPLPFYSTSLEWDFALSNIRRALVSHPGDADRIIRRLRGTRLSKENKNIIQHEMGLLRIPNAINLLNDAKERAKCIVEGEKFTRRATPLIIKVVRLGPQDHRLLFVFLKARLLPSTDRLEITSKSRAGAIMSLPQFTAIDDFFTEHAHNLDAILI